MLSSLASVRDESLPWQEGIGVSASGVPGGKQEARGAQGEERFAALILLCATMWPEVLALMSEQTVWGYPMRSLMPCS